MNALFEQLKLNINACHVGPVSCTYMYVGAFGYADDR